MENEKITFNEFDTIEIHNPLKEDFTVRFNGQPYTLASNSRKVFPYFLAFHIAKHLSDKLLTPDLEKIKKEKTGGEFNPKTSQLLVYDNPRRRMTLFDILGEKKLVQACIEAFPFKGFIGEMKDYDEYVEKKLTKAEPKDEEEKETKKKGA